MSDSASPLLSDQHHPIKEDQKPKMADNNNDVESQNAAMVANNSSEQQPVESKEEETERSPLISWAISFIVTGICFGVSVPTHTYFECAVSYGVNFASFLFIAWPFHTEKYYDFTGMITFLSCDLFSMFYRQVPWKLDYIRNIILFFMVMLWTLRLGSFLFKRILQKHGGKDKRFDNLRNNFPRFLVAWVLQATWGYFCCMPLFIVNQYDNNDVTRVKQEIWTPLDIVGWALWAFGWAFEIIADRQKTAFKNNPENRGKFCNVGLWSISRHPNYFGEITLWIGIFISSASVAKNAGWLAVLSPIWTIILLVFSSGIPLAERTSLKKYGDVPGYKEYVENVSVLIPLPCCWKGYI